MRNRFDSSVLLGAIVHLSFLRIDRPTVFRNAEDWEYWVTALFRILTVCLLELAPYVVSADPIPVHYAQGQVTDSSP